MKPIAPYKTAVLAALALLAGAAPAAAQQAHSDEAGLRVPESMRIEHEAIHARLEAAARASGPVGAAARELVGVVAPHFERENQIALPPLGLLAPLAHGEAIPPGEAARAIAMTDSLRAELPAMLEEHVRIGAAARRLEQVAREQGDAEVEEFARRLQLHARTEQEVSYPAAVLVGTLLRRT